MAKTIKQKDINLFNSLDFAKAKKKAGGGFRLAILLSILILVIIGGLYYLDYQTLSQLREENDELRSYTEDAKVLADFQKAQELQAQAQAATAKAGVIAGAVDNLKTYPDFTASEISHLAALEDKNAEILSTSYDRATGILTISGTTPEPATVAYFAAQLRISGLFDDVSYSGYAVGEIQHQSDPVTDPDTGEETVTVTTETVASFSITALVKPGEDNIIAREEVSE
jgi:hypothetical protein